MRTVVRSAAALPCSCSRLRCRQLSLSIRESSPRLPSSPESPRLAPPRLASCAHRSSCPPSSRSALFCSSTRERGASRRGRGDPVRHLRRQKKVERATIGRENRGMRWGDAIGWRGLAGPGTTPRGNSSPSLSAKKELPLNVVILPSFLRHRCVAPCLHF